MYDIQKTRNNQSTKMTEIAKKEIQNCNKYNCRLEINIEYSNTKRQNYWTGLRQSVIDDIAGRNWMTYYCLLRKTKYATPMDGIMFIINDFLNWMPSGCWYINNTKHGHYVCTICQIWYIPIRTDYSYSVRFPQLTNPYINSCQYFPKNFCSYQCKEKLFRIYLEEPVDVFIHYMKTFNDSPCESIVGAQMVIDDYSDYEEEDHSLFNDKWSNCGSDSD